MVLIADIHAMLRRHYPEDVDRLYAVALLRCIRQCANRYVEHTYKTSLRSERLPGLHLSFHQNLNNLMTGIGYLHRQMVAFMREFVLGQYRWDV